MYALFDDAGKFLAGRVMSEADASMQIELDSGKRVKAKTANVLLKFAKPAPAELLAPLTQGAWQAALRRAGFAFDSVRAIRPRWHPGRSPRAGNRAGFRRRRVRSRCR